VPTRIVVVSDTHCRDWEEVHPEIRRLVAEADVAIHCGDFTGMEVVEGMRSSARKAVVVHGNSDPVELRRAIPYVEVMEVEGWKIGVIHPAWGGPEFPMEELLQDFAEKPDVVIFGHLHVTINERRDGVLYLNPGQGYSSFMVPATIAILTVDSGGFSAVIQEIEPGRGTAAT
jgi:putative phosphoesterase